ncbi:hypothetical protein H0H93_002338 [Arthromyces matolae]|nr:hypothetical protein H0H93_002338 [Arthromyces matolae]
MPSVNGNSKKRRLLSADDLLKRLEQPRSAKKPRLNVDGDRRFELDGTSDEEGGDRDEDEDEEHGGKEVQVACIPPLLSGQDCIGNAQTGSGKTIAFALPILQKLAVDPFGIFALILTPTRELAFQIAEQFAVLGAPLSVRTAVVVGGMDMMAQALELGNRPHVVIATPGRIVDHLRSSHGEWNLSRVKFLVLDEADRLLMPTFSEELAYLFKVLPRDRQTCLFTATWTRSIEALAEAAPRPGKQKPFIHRMTEKVETVSTLEQSYLLVPSHVREVYLFHLLCNPPASIVHMRRAPPEPEKGGRRGQKTKSGNKEKKKSSANDEDEAPEQPPPTIIFCGRARTVAYLTNLLKTLGIRSTGLHSKLTQRERLTSLSLFRASVVPVLVSTDVGARGLDIEEVGMVVNWDVPREAEEYTHRVGRTARAGRGGVAVSFVTEKDEERIVKIEERIGIKLKEMEMKEEKVLLALNKNGKLVMTPPLIAVSTTFHPDARLRQAPPDIVLRSLDAVYFYVHTDIIPKQLHQSSVDVDVLDVHEPSQVLNIILHAIYDISCAHFSPEFSHINDAVKRLSLFGIDPKSVINLATPLFTLLLSYAPHYPLEIYTLAASNDLHDLAVASSPHLLSFPLSSLTDEMAQAIGPVYLKRLFFLHFGRVDALKRILLSPPHPHSPTSTCDFSDQKKITRAWALASAYLAWDARPDISTSILESTLSPLEEHLACEECKFALQTRIKSLLVQWSMVKLTI